MTSRYEQIKEWVLRVRSVSGEDRAQLLEELGQTDTELRDEVLSLLDFDSEISAQGSVSEIQKELSGERDRESDAEIPDSIGNFKIRRLLGEGGMGLVYEAVQTEPIRRTVALKLIKRGLDTSRTIPRFEAERQTLAMMEHPGIARVLDAGTAEDGRPFFVMELVEGEPIQAFCANRGLTLRNRLILFVEVCAAVQHAHQKGIIHRDLKPSNILVAESEGRPQLKVIDFGIAKAMEGVPTERTLFTTAGELVGTPEYMSPEQASGRPELVDSRTDIYALGVVLFELLTGQLPFPSSQLQAADLPEMLRIIQEDDPPKPSRCVSPDATRWKRELSSDLDWITLRALAKDPGQRYAAVSELAADIHRYLADQPIDAGPPSRSYRIRKFVRRNRATLISLVTLVIALVAGIVATTWQAVRATREQARAEQRLVDLGELANRFIFGVHDQVGELPGSTPVREYVVREAAEILEQLALDPEEQGAVLEPLIGGYARLGSAQLDLGQNELGSASFERSIEISLTALSSDPDSYRIRELLADSYNRLGRSHNVQGRIDEALASHDRAVDTYRFLVASHPESLSIQRGMSKSLMHSGFNLVRMGRPEEALQRYEESISIREQLLERADDDRARQELATALAYRGECYEDLGRPDEALASYRASADVFEAGWTADPQNALMLNRLAVTLGAVGGLLSDMGRIEESQATLERSLELRNRLCELDPRNVVSRRDLARGHLQLGHAHYENGEMGEARASYERAREIVTPMAADSTDMHAKRYLAEALESLAYVEMEAGRSEACFAWLDEVELLNTALLDREPGRQDHHFRESTQFWLRAKAWAARAGSSESREDRRDAWQSARAWHEKSRGVLLRMKEDDLLYSEDEEMIEERTREIAHCDSVLATLG